MRAGTRSSTRTVTHRPTRSGPVWKSVTSYTPILDSRKQGHRGCRNAESGTKGRNRLNASFNSFISLPGFRSCLAIFHLSKDHPLSKLPKGQLNRLSKSSCFPYQLTRPTSSRFLSSSSSWKGAPAAHLSTVTATSGLLSRFHPRSEPDNAANNQQLPISPCLDCVRACCGSGNHMSESLARAH